MLVPHTKQREIIISPARFKVIRAGRRSGKTTLQIEEMVFEATSHDNQSVFYVSPTQSQSRSIIWEALKSRLAGLAEFNEQRLEARVLTQEGGTSLIKVLGFEGRENLRGLKAHIIVFDELDTMIDFFTAWQEIFRPMLTDTRGKATFIGTPKKENPNLKRLEKIAETDKDYAVFHFPTHDNPHIPRDELEKAKQEVDHDTWRQEYLAEYVENTGALFGYIALTDVFTNTVQKTGQKYMSVDVAGEGSDKTVFSFWEDLEEYKREEYSGLSAHDLRMKIREYAINEQIPHSHIIVDAIGIGEGLPSEPLLHGIVGFKSSYGAIKTEASIVALPNVHYLKEAPLVSEYANLRSQCVFLLARHVNERKIASRVQGRFKELVIEELSHYHDDSKGDGKRFASDKDSIKEHIGRSPDHSDTWVMRMYFEIIKGLSSKTGNSPIVNQKLRELFARNRNAQDLNSAR
jgi:hypothetical protein